MPGKTFSRFVRFGLLGLVSMAATAVSAETLPIVNPDLSLGLTGWTVVHQYVVVRDLGAGNILNLNYLSNDASNGSPVVTQTLTSNWRAGLYDFSMELYAPYYPIGGPLTVKLLDATTQAVVATDAYNPGATLQTVNLDFQVAKGASEIGDPVEILLTMVGPTGDTGAVNFALTVTPVPEPATWALMGAGLLSLGALGLRRRPYRAARA